MQKQTPPAEFLGKWHLTNPRLVADTALASVWKVTCTNGSMAVLKIYRRMDRGNEAAGSRLMSEWQDRGTVKVLFDDRNAILMEWLDGLTLGDQAHSGHPVEALSILAETAADLHRGPKIHVEGLKPLDQVFAPLFGCRFAENSPAPLRHDMARAISLAHDLLLSQFETRPLHGDLHPDNVILTQAGPRIIDAKGYLGELGFELANALRHPIGLPDLVRQPGHIQACLSMYANALDISRARLAQWAAAKCALSIFWRSKGTIDQDDESDLLALLLCAAAQ